MIETVLLNYLNSAGLSAQVYMEQPAKKPSAFFILESLANAAHMNEEIKQAMFNAVTLDEISKVELNSNYNYTDSATKQYRYQAVYVVVHY